MKMRMKPIKIYGKKEIEGETKWKWRDCSISHVAFSADWHNSEAWF